MPKTQDPFGALRADCANCHALCCRVPAFSASTDFAIDKPAGRACPNLLADHRCGIHDQLRPKGFVGCTVYDCFGAGQKVTRVAPDAAQTLFPVMRDLHELLWYLAEARGIAAAAPLRADLDRALAETEALTDSGVAVLRTLDVPAHRHKVNALLLKVSERARAGSRGKDHRGANLMGARFRRADLRGASLRGAYLIGADLREADLRGADVIGADLRGSDLRGANLTGALFLIQSQVDSARGDKTTKLPTTLSHPRHW
ncbi:pentapeptide repeat-containing protein [Actinokineospora terrae]|uniref:Pentapeptide repeat-containing protein n=1 Tax=Actinokineospora terrae TaxID=155974 RepID=A0A1H9KHV0_9PSEU|nr:pentapeptide repeat-containing protein [Actinokineospora terrae]SEQ98423.1 Pentapeptide repeat-containing protein [Actinokineospora terrae]